MHVSLTRAPLQCGYYEAFPEVSKNSKENSTSGFYKNDFIVNSARLHALAKHALCEDTYYEVRSRVSRSRASGVTSPTIASNITGELHGEAILVP